MESSGDAIRTIYDARHGSDRRCNSIQYVSCTLAFRTLGCYQDASARAFVAWNLLVIFNKCASLLSAILLILHLSRWTGAGRIKRWHVASPRVLRTGRAEWNYVRRKCARCAIHSAVAGNRRVDKADRTIAQRQQIAPFATNKRPR